MKTKPSDEIFTPKQREVIARDLSDQGAQEKDIERFLLLCETTRLNPISRQIYARIQNVNKGDDQNPKWVKEIVIITSIDGLRAIAECTGEYAGQQGPYWCNKDGVWRDIWVPDQTYPYAAKVGVLRKGFQEPLYGVARFDSFVQKAGRGNDAKPNRFWRVMPDLMIAKCAEAGAIRRAFPQLLAGLYIEEEINDNPDTDPLPEPAPTPGRPVTPVSTPAAATPEPEPPTAKPEPPKKSAKATQPAKTPAPAPEPQPEPENTDTGAQTQTGEGWEDYVIKEIKVDRYRGLRLGDLKAEDFAYMKQNWVDKNATKFADPANAAKKHEADMILEGYKAHLAKEAEQPA